MGACWQQCLNAYRQTLAKDFGRLRTSASHGLTQAQADIMPGKMKRLQSVYFSPEGNTDEPPRAVQARARDPQGRPLAGVLLMTDGNATDSGRCVIRLPSARLTALPTAASGATIGVSPTPRTP